MRYIGFAMAAIAALALIIGAAGSGTVSAAKHTMRGMATGAEENPPVAGGAAVNVTVDFDDVTNTLTYRATISGLSIDQVTASHFHRGARGVNGPVVHTLSATGFTQIAGTVQLSAADVADLRAGNFYFNAHSKDNPGGFARFQLNLPASAAAPAAPSAPIAPPRTGDAGLASSSTLLPLVGLLALSLSGVGVLSLARKRN